MVQEHFCSSNALASLHSFQIYRERVIIIQDLALLSEDVILASIITHIDRACLADPNCATLRVKWSMPGFRPLSVHDAFAQIFEFMQHHAAVSSNSSGLQCCPLRITKACKTAHFR